ncbi:MAG: IS200/IS605 family transposase [Candidatus Paceibacterota bacterium]|jgi:putative transposase
MEYMTKTHSKFLLQYHFIFVVKYRKNIIGKYPIKEIFQQLQENRNFVIETMEVDKDHIHLLVRTEPKISPLQIVRKLKQESTVRLWKEFSKELKKDFWKERTFWSDGYFVSTIGNVSEETLRRYIEEQG